MKTRLMIILAAIMISGSQVVAQKTVIDWKILSFGIDKAVPVNGYAISTKDTNIHYAISKTTFYKSTDGGATWSVSAPKVGGYMFWMNKLPILIHPENPDIVYLGNLHGVSKSTDGGTTWETKKVAPGICVLLFNPTDPNELWAASAQAGGKGGVYVSKDAGETWQQKLKNRPTLAFDVDPTDFRMMYVGTGGGNFEKSSDGGLTWRSKKPHENELKGMPAVTGLAINPAQPNVLLITVNNAIFSSKDGGETWIPEPSGYNIGRDIRYNPVNPSEIWAISNPLLGAAGGKGSKVFFSNDAGKTYLDVKADVMMTDHNKREYQGANAKFNSIYFSPDGKRVYICTSSGVIYTDSRGVE